MRGKQAIAATVAAVLVAGCAGTPAAPDRETARAQVEARERAFAGTMAARNFAAFGDFVSAEGVFFNGDETLRGREVVERSWQRFYTAAEAPFSWEPDLVVVLDSGTLALSTGPVRNAAGKLFARFQSTWRLESDGVWRVVFDRGNPVCD